MTEKFSEVRLKDVYGKYGSIVCENCKEQMKPLGQKIADRLNKGKKPRMRHTIKLQNCLCRECYYAVLNKIMEGGGWKH